MYLCSFCELLGNFLTKLYNDVNHRPGLRMNCAPVSARTSLLVECAGRRTTFCASCNKSGESNAKYCHNCGQKGNESNVKGESKQSEKGESSGRDAKVTETSSSGRMSFAQYRALKKEDRAKHFTKNNRKRFKLDKKGKTLKALTCMIQVGNMINKDHGLRVKRGNNTTLPDTGADI